MDLWTEYEGLTVDGSFPLKKLLQPEGRSAFFATTNPQGEAILIRLIECHFDEEEILARWRGVEALGHPDFLKIDRFGQLVIDDTTVVYAAFEKVETDLATVLEEGSLTAADATEIGLSLVSALETLHAHGFVHEHIEARNVFAVSEAVKLRSDCIRETPEGEAGEEARRRDVQDLAALIKHVLLGTRRFRRVHVQTPLPSPFEEVVRNGASGLWGLKEIRLALTPSKVPEQVVTSAPEPEKQAPKTVSAGEKPFSFKKPAHVEAASRPEKEQPPKARPLRGGVMQGAGLDRWSNFDAVAWIRDPRNQGRRWMLAGALALVVLLFGYLCVRWMFRGPAVHKSATSSSVGQTHREKSAAATPLIAVQSRHEPSRETVAAGSTPARAGAAARTEWRVVAFTYNQESQARKKASSLAQKHPDLKPDVFSPTGRAPWLVTVGGAMQREEAYGLARRARSLGLPRDTYAQNYAAR